LERPWEVEKIPRAKRPVTMPVILEKGEVRRLLAATNNLKHKAILAITYGSGLRISEVAHLMVGDIDSARMTVLVRQGKCRRDRYTILSTTALDTLVPYLRTYRPVSWLFPGAIAGRPITASTIGAVMWHAKKRAGITKRVSVHSLRHNSESPIIPSSLSSVGESLALRRIALGIIRGSSEKQGACHPAGSDGSLCRTVRPWREPFL